MGYTYILKCNDDSYYVGAASNNFLIRLSNHQNGEVKYTKSRLPVKPVFVKEFETYREARLFENKIKSWKKRKSIEVMFNKQDNVVSRYN